MTIIHILSDFRLPERLEVCVGDVGAVLSRVLELPQALVHVLLGMLQLLQLLGRLKEV